jgi:Zn-finger nucleic acid-binding protein
MDCPHCRKPMAILELEGIEIDHCLACGGTWLDSGEFETLAQRAGVEAGCPTELLAAATGGTLVALRCPRCGEKLRVIHPVGGLELDRCPRGDGLWFDRGELRKLIAAWGAADHDAEEALLARFLGDILGATL